MAQPSPEVTAVDAAGVTFAFYTDDEVGSEGGWEGVRALGRICVAVWGRRG